MNAQTMRRVNLLAKFESVDYAKIERIAYRRSHCVFFLLHNGEEKIVNASELNRILAHDDYIKVLGEAGNIAIVGNVLISILEA